MPEFASTVLFSSPCIQSRQHLALYKARLTTHQVMDENDFADEPEPHGSLPLQDILSHAPDSPTHDANHHDDTATQDADHLNDATTHSDNSLDDISSAAASDSIVVVCQNHDRNVTDECTAVLHDDEKMLEVSESSSPSHLTELSRRSFFSPSTAGGAKPQKPVAVVSPMRQSASEVVVTPESAERQRPRSSSKPMSTGMCQTSQTFNLGGPSSPRSLEGHVVDAAASHSSDLCASSIDLSPSSRSDSGGGGAGSSHVFFSANQEQFRKFDRPLVTTTQTNELDLLHQSNFFYGHLSRSKVKAKLRHSEDGTFLVRFSSDPMFPFALSIKTPNGVTSVRLTRTPNGLIRLDCDPGQADRMPAFPSVLDLVVNYVREEGTGRRPHRSHCIYLEGVGLSETVLDLKKPFEESPASLGHLCRRRINALVPTFRRWNLIETLVAITPKDNVRNLVEFLDAYPYRV